MRGGLTGADTAHALISAGDLRPLRLQKAAQHLKSDQQRRDFFEALQPLPDAQRALIEHGIKVYLA